MIKHFCDLCGKELRYLHICIIKTCFLHPKDSMSVVKNAQIELKAI